jgi:hypothetical protein
MTLAEIGRLIAFMGQLGESSDGGEQRLELVGGGVLLGHVKGLALEQLDE